MKSNGELIQHLYEAFWFKLNHSLMGLVRCKSTAEDIAHDAFLRMFSLEYLEDIKSPYTYLYRTCLNIIRDRAKAQKVRENYKQYVSSDENRNIDLLTPENYVLDKEQLKILTRAIESLPTKCRQIFLLHKVQQFTHKEIAEQFGISKHAVEKHIIRAMERCQQRCNRG